MIFNRSQKYDFQPELKIGDVMLNVVTKTTILGVTLTESLSWQAHIDSIITKARSRIFILINLMNNDFEYQIILDVYYKEI